VLAEFANVMLYEMEPRPSPGESHAASVARL